MYETKSDVGDEWAIRRQGTDAGLKKKTSRSFAKPKKVKSLGRLFAGRDDEPQQLQTFVTASSMPMTMQQQQQYQIGFNATATVLQYPPKPLRYSPDVSPPSDDILPSSPLTLTSRLKARRSCTLKMPAIDADNVAFPHPAESSGRRTSAPTVAPRRTKSRVFSFLWSK